MGEPALVLAVLLVLPRAGDARGLGAEWRLLAGGEAGGGASDDDGGW